jgi:hypothetical protein
MMFWKNWFLDAYYNNIYSKEYLIKKLEILQDSEDEWKGHPNYNSYKASILGLKSAIRQISLNERVTKIQQKNPKYEPSIHHPAHVEKYLLNMGDSIDIENLCYFYANEEYQAEIDEAIIKNIDIDILKRWIHLMTLLGVHLELKTYLVISQELTKVNIEILNLKGGVK